MNTQNTTPYVGQVFHFGARRVPNKVVRVLAPTCGGVPVELEGPRGGKSLAIVHGSGRVSKL